jgi:hypothetical protein
MPAVQETESTKQLRLLNSLLESLPPERCNYDPQSEQLTLSFNLFGRPELNSGLIIEPSEDHTQLIWSIHHNRVKTTLETEAGDWYHTSPVTMLGTMYFGFLSGTGAELHYDARDPNDPPEQKFLIIRSPSESPFQIRFSIMLDTTYHGIVSIEPTGRAVHQLAKAPIF